ncbi:MAG: amino acid adenylation domain-containing protein [Ferruginibacter sp.]|nr:amino acid adenylation domain-containing protein [Ferruginibacter sp.]
MPTSIEIQPGHDHFPLSFSQERLWFTAHLEGDVHIQHHLAVALRLKGRMNINALSGSLQTIVSRHEVLRSMILEEDGKPYLKIQDYKDWRLTKTNISTCNGETIQTLIQQIIDTPFDLSLDYLLRADLIVMDDTDHILVITTHRHASDNQSISLIIKELVELYGSIEESRPSTLSLSPIQYPDYTIWQRKYHVGVFMDNKMAYWKEKLKDLPSLQLPVDFARPVIQSTAGASVVFSIDKELANQVNLLCQQQDSTLFMTMLAAFNVLLHRYSGQQDICVGTTVPGREQEQVEGLIGFFENRLALRSEVSDDISFAEFLGQVKNTVISAYEHQEAPFERVVETVAKDNDPGNNPIFQVMFGLTSKPLNAELKLKELILSVEKIENKISNYAISLFITETTDGFAGSVEYCTGLYQEATMIKMIDHYKNLLRSIVETPHQKMGSLPMLTTAEEQELLEEFNNTGSAYPKDKTLVELFEEQVVKTPGKMAVLFEEQQISYEALNSKANQLAHWLRIQGVKAESLVPVCVARSVEMIVTILGILKAGAAYVPIDPNYPAERIRFMLEDTGAGLIVSDKAGIPALSAMEHKNIININNDWFLISQQPTNNLGVAITPHNLAYVIYTSGSTGNPKGVMVEHINVVSLVSGVDYVNFTSDDILLSTGSPSFDATTFEYWGMLLNGGQLVLCPEDTLLNSVLLKKEIEVRKVNKMWFTSSWFNQLVETDITVFETLKTIVAGGEKLSEKHIEKIRRAYPAIEIINGYGPTENTTFSLTYNITGTAINSTIPIGRPISNRSVFILNGDGQIVPIGVTGEIYVGGAGLARGYLNRPDLTKEKFIKHPFSTETGSRLYKTGDLGRWLPGGNIAYTGRIDDQVKIRGFRIEPGEIETVLQQCELVEQAVVLARDDNQFNKQLVAYIVPHGSFDPEAITNYINDKLPAYMAPSFWVEMKTLPLTSNGKINRNALPDPGIYGSMKNNYAAPVNELENALVEIWQGFLGVERIGIKDNFFKLGGNSLLAMKTISILSKQFNYVLPVIKLYQYPTIAGIVAYLQPEHKKAVKIETRLQNKPSGSSDVAVIGMAGRFPGANTVEELWEILKTGKETIRFFTKAELDESISTEVKNDPDYVSARGIIDGADKFDHDFFELNPKLAELMDPQQRIFLEIAWEVLEKTGYLPQKYPGIIGVYAGAGINTYYQHNVFGHTDLIDQVGSFQVMMANETGFISTRTAYQLNLKGPAVTVFSGCSTSLLAIAQAVESIRNGQCDVAIAGAASITSPIYSGHLFQEGAMLSRDGHCRSFDADSSGTVFSDGAGVVLLKTAEAAERDGDTIYAIIKGVGINNDGGEKGSFTAPSSEGQAQAVVMAIHDAGIDPATIGYVETHGTGTPIGDPIEIEGLKMAFGKQPKQRFCAIGSVKSNMGHLTAAAGVAGLIKAALALHHRQIPPSIGFVNPNPNIDFENSPFYVNTKLTDWKAGNVRRAGVNSLGVGGTNIHIILEEFENKLISSSTPVRPLQLITWSAKSVSSVDGYALKLADYLNQNNYLNLADAAFTLQKNRADFNCRRFLLASNTGELSALLLKNPVSLQDNHLKEIPSGLVFMFPGQGSQYLNMGVELYQNEPVYRQAIDECAAILLTHTGPDIREIIFPANANPEAEALLKNTRYTQPAIFVTEYALAKLWMSWGIEPAVLCGHSIGEFVAAYFAGVFSLEDVLLLIASRGKMISELPGGAMLSVRMEVKELMALIPGELSVAAINSNKQCVVAGEAAAIAAFSGLLDQQRVANKLLLTSHAFHSTMMDAIVRDFEKIVSRINLNFPRLPIVSTVTGNWLTDAEATDPHYWAKQVRSTVVFANAAETILNMGGRQLFLEVGPGTSLTTLVKQQPGNRAVTMMPSLENNRPQSDYASILKTLGELWQHGVKPDWEKFYDGQKRNIVNLPTYYFDKKYCWVNPVNNNANHQPRNPQTNTVPYNQPLELPGPALAGTRSKPTIMRKDFLITKIKEILENASGIDTIDLDSEMSFLEIGLDSLLLTQVAITLKKEFELGITFRQLSEQLASPELLAKYLDEQLPANKFQSPNTVQPQYYQQEPVTDYTSNANNTNGCKVSDSGLELITQQLQILGKQIALIQGQGGNAGISSPVIRNHENRVGPHPMGLKLPPGKPNNIQNNDLTPEEAIEIKKPFGATARIERQVTELDDKQKSFLTELTAKYNEKTKGSKAYADQHRPYMADPRVVSGFKPLTKEIVYPLVMNESRGSKLWDIDGNEYIDVLNGFGSCMFGYQPDFIKKALHEQVEKGFEVGPQHELAGEVCRMICDFTGADRAALCSTGSEAVLGTMRIARTVTGRSLIVAFTGSYHGIIDEVIVRGTKKLKSFPAAPGIMSAAVQNMLILDYGTEESLQIIKERAQELAAVLVEPVQSRRPEFRPVEFLKQVREITSLSGTALIFDEVITGFRMHPGGAQALFGIKPDISAYGKVIGGGLPIGVIAGKREWMDALDGGAWQYGDTSFPEVGVTYFAGTFVRHPLVLATAKASLQHMKDKGPDLQRQLNAKGDQVADSLNAEFEKRGLPLVVAQFGSLWKIKFKEEVPYGELLFTLMRLKGVHVWDGFPCFITESHTYAEIDKIINLFTECADELVMAGFFKANNFNDTDLNGPASPASFINPPLPGAKLGRDEDGNPAWYISDISRPGKYLQVTLNK